MLLVVVLIALIWAWESRQLPRPSPVATQRQRLLLPRAPDDCPACRQGAVPTDNVVGRSAAVVGGQKSARRHGPHCDPGVRLSQSAVYRPIESPMRRSMPSSVTARMDAASVFRRCARAACGATFSTRRDTPLYRLKTASQRVAEVLTVLAEGLSLADAVRVFGHRHATITTWLTRAGAHSVTLHERFFRRLHLPHLQFDELRTRLRNRTHVLWLWLAIDPLTKIIPVLHHPEGTRPANPGRCPCGGARAAWTAGERLPAGVEERRLESVLLRPHRTFWPVGGQRHAAGPEVASSQPN
jgi:hypothetical protein